MGVGGRPFSICLCVAVLPTLTYTIEDCIFCLPAMLLRHRRGAKKEETAGVRFQCVSKINNMYSNAIKAIMFNIQNRIAIFSALSPLMCVFLMVGGMW